MCVCVCWQKYNQFGLNSDKKPFNPMINMGGMGAITHVLLSFSNMMRVLQKSQFAMYKKKTAVSSLLVQEKVQQVCIFFLCFICVQLFLDLPA